MRALIGHALTDEDGAPRTGDDGEPLIEPAKLIFSSQVTSDSAAKKKGGGRGAKQVLSQKIRVSGEFLKEWFSNCTKEINWLAPEGPFAQPQFISIICAAHKTAQKDEKRRLGKAKPEELMRDKAVEVGTVTARAAARRPWRRRIAC